MTQSDNNGIAPNAHGCEYTWCRSDRAMSKIEHWGDGVLDLSHQHLAEIDEIHCYAFVTLDGQVYQDEITFAINGRGHSGGGYTYSAALSVDEATRLRDLIDTAIANRAEIRGR